jgi:WhiB family redox-sensing transcriptional regulator
MTGWRDGAVCAQTDPELFFPRAGDAAANARAKSVCAGCPVRAECLEAALADPSLEGIWGGTSARDRGALRAGTAREAA